MADLMRPVPFSELIRRMLGEYKTSESLFGIHKDQFFRPEINKNYTIFNESCSVPLGPAAGPHTQLAQNIVSAYLTGSRFIELKTVQILDTLEIKKPCIDAKDEAFNTEWSSEFTLTKAFDEYLKAWFLLHFLEILFGEGKIGERSFIFNMSVGYNLEGIQNSRVDAFIEGLKDASNQPAFKKYQKELITLLKDKDLFSGTGLEKKVAELSKLPASISPMVCSQLTLSTMHGCPPDEIEKICRYMITEKKLDTFVKLNPTLLGYDFVNQFIQKAGYDYIQLKPEAFSHDLSYKDAVPMLKRLKKQADDNRRFFGFKLTNTLGTINNLGRLPGDEMYMSGRLLFPLSINVASRLAFEFDGDIPISFSGGISHFNLEEVLSTGIRPLTLATDMLKPGGYHRMKQLAEQSDSMDIPKDRNIDLQALKQLADKSLTSDYIYSLKQWHGFKEAKITDSLPLFDCTIAPCQWSCPIHQDIPAYIRLVAEERYEDALELIYSKNPLPSITGHICAHQCQYNCTRIDYERPVEIREIKKIALQQGWETYRQKWKKTEIKRSSKAAVIGAGPAGLATSFYLAREGFSVTVFEERDSAGGVVKYQIPDFRISREAIEHDIDFIKEHGVEFIFGHKSSFNPDEYKAMGYDYILFAAGADKVRSFKLEGDNKKILSSFSLIGQFNKDKDSLSLGEHVVIVGAGDTAMDSARTALRCHGVKEVTLVYRRSERQIPATEEEYEDCQAENIRFMWLRNPERFDNDGTLTLRVMELGEPDDSGRHSPVPTDKTETLHCDTLIPSIGETIDIEEMKSGKLPGKIEKGFLTNESLELEKNVFLIGDGRTGPTTIVNCMAEACKASDAILQKEGLLSETVSSNKYIESDANRISLKKGILLPPLDRKSNYSSKTFSSREGSRCLECDAVCNKCVDVCPNRANIAISIPGMKNRYQIIHLDAYCNECGNCATFCPWEGKPYTDKITLFSRLDDFENSANSGFYRGEEEIYFRQNNSVTRSVLEPHSIPRQFPSSEMKAVFEIISNQHNYLLGSVEE